MQSVGGETTKSDWTSEESYSTFADFRQNRKKREFQNRIELKILEIGFEVNFWVLGQFWVKFEFGIWGKVVGKMYNFHEINFAKSLADFS